MVKLLIADVNRFFAQGVTYALRNESIKAVGHIDVATEVVDAYARLKPDVLLCDSVFGHPMSGLDILQDLLEKIPTANVVLLAEYDLDRIIHSSYRRGAKAVLHKSTSAIELVDAIHRVARGDMYFSAENAIKLARMNFDKREINRDLSEILNEKEIEVLRLLSDGFTEKEVASHLVLSVKTIANMKAAIKEKLNIKRNSSLTKIALKHQLIGWEERVGA